MYSQWNFPLLIKEMPCVFGSRNCTTHTPPSEEQRKVSTLCCFTGSLCGKRACVVLWPWDKAMSDGLQDGANLQQLLVSPNPPNHLHSHRHSIVSHPDRERDHRAPGCRSLKGVSSEHLPIGDILPIHLDTPPLRVVFKGCHTASWKQPHALPPPKSVGGKGSFHLTACTEDLLVCI
mmetsp:Transcript_15346/g.35499  ORF Transcript_15346/g.35499 Transcript_15346/m.35499 type:complete len:177 (-) Transcript_15346:31-561(-)